MSVDVTGNQLLLKGANRMAIVRRLCARPGMSRSDLATALGLTRSSVTFLVRELLSEGWLVEREVVTTGDIGRRPTPLFIDPQRLFLLGAEVGVGRLRVVATSLSGTVLDSRTVDFDAGGAVEDCIEALAKALLAVHRRMDAPGRRVVGVGVGLPGGVVEEQALLQFAPNLGWRAVPVGRLLQQKLSRSALAGVPLFMQNEADVAAVGEVEFNGPNTADPLLYLSINQGLGAGVIVRDKLLTGNRGFAGEVGHVILQLDGPPCSCGRRGCAEALINVRAMSGVPEGIAEAGRYLGVLLQNLAVAYDPGCIVLGGGLVELGDAFLGPARDTLRGYAAAAGLQPPPVRTSCFGADAVAVGAAALARYRLIRPLARPPVAAPRGHQAPGGALAPEDRALQPLLRGV